MSVQSQSIPSVARNGPIVKKEPHARLRKWLVGLSLGLILLLAVFLRFYQLGATSVGNTYYAATVKSMLTSWHNFFYASFEPGGSVTVDKPPLGFWVQAVSAYFLGVNGFALALPNALAGVFSVLLLYLLVKRHFGTGAALIAALALAVTPVAVSTERNNTIDGLLVFVLLLAAWAFIESVRQGKFRYLLLGAFLVGVGFNIKMLQAYLPLPAFFALYFFAARHPWWKRVLHLAAATAVLLVVSLSWAVIVDLTPPEERPFIGSSKDNTVMELIVGHNGISRLFSRWQLVDGSGVQAPAPVDGAKPQNPLPGAPGAQPGSPPGNVPPQGRPPLPPNASPPGAAPQPSTGGDAPPTGLAPDAPPAPGGGTGPAAGGNGRSGEVGEPGWERLFSEPLVTEAGWLLPFALLGLPLILWKSGWSWPLKPRLQGVLLWGGWLLPEMLYFSFTSGIMHAYYLIMLGPPLAALVGATVWSLWQALRKRAWLGGLLAALLSAVTLLFQYYTLQNADAGMRWVMVVALLAFLGGLALLWWKRPAWLSKAALGLVCLSLLLAPMSWSIWTTINPNPNVMLPRSGPAGGQSTNPPAQAQTQNYYQISPLDERILAYLLENTPQEAYLLATLNARQAAPFILATGRPVLTFGGFSGSDAIVDVERLSAMVTSGELRYVLDDGSLRRQKTDLYAWVSQNCQPADWSQIGVPVPSRNQPGRQQSNAPVLYDCAP